MMDNKSFELGDRVRCVSKSEDWSKRNYDLIEIGRVYTVDSYWSNKFTLKEINEKHSRRPLFLYKDFILESEDYLTNDPSEAWNRAFGGM